jgi:hypothetical protein
MPPGRQVSVLQTSVVTAPPEEVRRRAASPEGINHELDPLLRMTMPSALAGRTIEAMFRNRHRRLAAWFGPAGWRKRR